jgi:hypothetical protein
VAATLEKFKVLTASVVQRTVPSAKIASLLSSTRLVSSRKLVASGVKDLMEATSTTVVVMSEIYQALMVAAVQLQAQRAMTAKTSKSTGPATQ